MKKNIATKFTLVSLTVLVLGFACYQAIAQSQQGDTQTRQGISSAPRADIITIDRTGEGFAARENPPVTFLHDLHTTALGREARDCVVCHGTTERGYFDWKQAGTSDKSGNALMDAYHLACTTCHIQRAAANLKAGPVARENNCIICHADPIPFESIAMQVRMPLSLHAVHNTSAQISPPEGETGNCATCHHTVVDVETNALVLERGQEQPCFSCHKAQKENNTPAVDYAAHQTCLTCHVDFTLKGISTGPTNCSTCHAVPLFLERKYLDIRLEREQPDTTFVFPQNAPGEPLPTAMMPPAVFNHALHEGMNDNCSICHHQRIDTCGKCHTVFGEANGDYINVYQTSHVNDPRAVVRLLQSPPGNSLWSPGQSCTGCHQTTALQTKECSACHSSVTAVQRSVDNCGICHVPFGGNAGSRQTTQQLAALPNALQAQMAVQAVELRDSQRIFADFDVSKDVIISVLADEYLPVSFPHDKLVRQLLAPTRESRLATAFHRGDILACAGCHHNSTPSLNPPTCASCHPIALAQANRMDRLPLKQAYHQLCMSCHTNMQVAEPANANCVGCHERQVLFAQNP